MSYTNDGYRITEITNNPGNTWIFLPGGPGLGSAYLAPFCKNLSLPGSILLLDFPKDGTNPQGKLDINEWKIGLKHLLNEYAHPILVTHSFSGMLVMTMPEIEDHLSGLIIMNTTTKNSFFEHVAAMQQKYHLPDLIPAASAYHLNPSDETYREFWNTYKHYCFTPEELPLGEKLLPLFAFNNAAYHHAILNFFPTYQCVFYPKKIPTMTIAADKDFVCPPDTFINNQHFQANNISNKLIKNAGHCPWILNQANVQACFNEYLASLGQIDIP